MLWNGRIMQWWAEAKIDIAFETHSQEEVAEMRKERGIRIRKGLIKMPGSPDVGQRRRLAKLWETGDVSSIHFTCHRSHRTAAIKNSWKVCCDSLIAFWESESVHREGGRNLQQRLNSLFQSKTHDGQDTTFSQKQYKSHAENQKKKKKRQVRIGTFIWYCIYHPGVIVYLFNNHKVKFTSIEGMLLHTGNISFGSVKIPVILYHIYLHIWFFFFFTIIKWSFFKTSYLTIEEKLLL